MDFYSQNVKSRINGSSCSHYLCPLARVALLGCSLSNITMQWCCHGCSISLPPLTQHSTQLSLWQCWWKCSLCTTSTPAPQQQFWSSLDFVLPMLFGEQLRVGCGCSGNACMAASTVLMCIRCEVCVSQGGQGGNFSWLMHVATSMYQAFLALPLYVGTWWL